MNLGVVIMIIKQTKVSELIFAFEGELEKYGYSEDSFRRYRKVFRELIDFTEDGLYSQKICTDFLVDRLERAGGFFSAGESSKNQMYYLRAIRSLADYFNFGTIFRRKDIGEFIIWPEGYRKLIEDYLAILVSRKLAQRYIRQNEHLFKDFITYLDAQSVSDLADIEANHVSGFVGSLVGFAPKTISSKVSILRRLLCYAYLEGYIDKSLSDVLPKVYCTRTTLPTVWTPEEIQKILKAVDRGNPTGKRNYAMILMVARLGLRIGDVKDLKLTDIDWHKNCVRIQQNKTEAPLTLPLLNDVGWAIIEYLKNGRPPTDSDNVFVRHNPPFISFASTYNLHGMISGIISKAGISPGKKPCIGMHSLRHSLASGLLQNNVEVNVISEILGHSSPDSVRHYIRVDLPALRQCSLNVEVGQHEEY
jgi:site-specific recombinase XerD